MSEFIKVSEAAKRWGISERRIAVLCKNDRIPGAYKNGRSWELPADGRIKSGIYVQSGRSAVLRLPVGVSGYVEAVSEYYYVDKTLLIKDYLDDGAKVTLFTRPRRFGKTLNMDMLRTYFEKTEEDNSVYFKDKAIWKCGEIYRRHQGRYPVIFLSFRDAKLSTWDAMLEHIRFTLANEYKRHSELAESTLCTPLDRAYYQKIVSETASSVEMMMALAEEALQQIEERKYDTELAAHGVDRILKYGAAFSGKHVFIYRNIYGH